MDIELQRLVRIARVDLERALHVALEEVGPAAVLAGADPGDADEASTADALVVLCEAARLALNAPERTAADIVAECLTTEWMTASAARLYRVSLKPGQAVTEAHRRLLGTTPVARVDSVGEEEVWAGWVDVVRGIHVAFSRIEGTPRTRRVGAEEGRLIAQVARAIEGRAARGQSVVGLWDRLEAIGEEPNVDYLAAAEELVALDPEDRLVLSELCAAHLAVERDAGAPQAASSDPSRAALDELIAGSGLAVGPGTVDALLAALRAGDPVGDPGSALLVREESGGGLAGVLSRLAALYERATGQPLPALGPSAGAGFGEERRERARALRRRLGAATVPELPSLAEDGDTAPTPAPESAEVPEASDAFSEQPAAAEERVEAATPPRLTVTSTYEAAVLCQPVLSELEEDREGSLAGFWEPEIPDGAPTAVSAEPSVAALLPRRDVIEDLDAADISVVRERELEAQLIASDEARESVRSGAAALEIELERARVELRAARREAEALRRERQLLLGRVDGALRVLTGSQGSVVQLLSQIEGGPVAADVPLLEPAAASPGLTRFAIGTAIALVVAAVLVIAYLPSRPTTATGPANQPPPSAPAPSGASKARQNMMAFAHQGGAAAVRQADSRASDPEPEQVEPETAELAPADAAMLEPEAAAEPIPMPEGFEASLMLTRRSKAFVHGDRRTRVVMELPEGPRMVGSCIAAQSTPEQVGSPVYPGYEAVRIPCTGPYRDVCDALGCDDASDRCDVAVSVVVPCGAPLPPAGGGPASAAAPRFAATLALGSRAKVYSREARDAVELSTLPGGDEVLGQCLFATATLEAAGTKAYPGYEPVALRCDGSGAKLCEALGCFNPDGICHLLASGVRGCSR